MVGVEIEPSSARQDILTRSFDELPISWDGWFSLVYSNSFDHSSDSEKTAKEWLRTSVPNGHILLGFVRDSESTLTDPIGGLTFDDMSQLFGGKVIYYSKHGTMYSDLIVKKN